MGVSIVRFEQSGQRAQWGIAEQDEIAVLQSAYPSHRELMDAYFSDPATFSSESLARLSRSEVRFLAPVSRGIQIFCQGLNYASHREEGGVDVAKGQLAILLNFTNDEKRRSKLVKTQESVRYLQPGDKLTLSLKSRDGSLNFGTQNTGVRDATS